MNGETAASAILQPPPRLRRTQEERRLSTRTQLLDATIACLDELGFARTTTTEIAQRAGVSRGAQLHHFPTKHELVVTAVEHLFERRHAEFLAAFAARRPETHPLETAIDLLWANVNGPAFRAYLELLVAARTDLDLHARVAPLTRRFSERVEASFMELFGDDFERGPFFSHAPQFAFALLDGLALNRIAESNPEVAAQGVETLKFLARTLMPVRTAG